MRTHYANNRAEAEKMALELAEDKHLQSEMNKMIDIMPIFVNTEQGTKLSVGVCGKNGVIGQILFDKEEA